MADGTAGELPMPLDPRRAPPPGPATLHFRPEEARLLAPSETLDGLVFHGTVALSAYPGGRWRATIRVGAEEVLVDVPDRVAEGASVRLGIPMTAAHLFAATELQRDRRAEVMPAH